MACCFAAYLLFNRCALQPDGTYAANSNTGMQYSITDDKAVFLAEAWQLQKPVDVVAAALQNESLWGENLASLPDFGPSVAYYLDVLITHGAAACLEQLDNLIARGG
jgi:tagaturonate reductase